MNAVRRLEETGNALREAMVQQDWTSISVLDSQCRQVVEAAMSEPRENESAIRQHLQELTLIYRELVSACQAGQKRVTGELIQINKSQRGANIYKLFG